jgi:hypothetical protein
VLYAALTGRWPQAEAGPTRLPDATRDNAGNPIAPRQARAGVPGPLSDLASELLDPAATPPSADVLAAELSRMDVQPDDQIFGGDGFDLGEFVPAGPAEPTRRKGRKMLVGVTGLLVIAMLGLFAGVRWVGGSGDEDQPRAGGGVTRPSQSPAAPQGQPTQLRLSPGKVRIVDPPQSDRSELDGAGYVVDGDPRSAWITDHYSTADFGRRKPGMGVLIDRGAERDVSSVTVAMTTPGATVSIWKVARDPGATSSGDAYLASAKGHEQIGESSHGEDSGSTLVFPVGENVRYLVVWVSRLAEVKPVSGLRYQAGIEDIKVLVART